MLFTYQTAVSGQLVEFVTLGVISKEEALIGLQHLIRRRKEVAPSLSNRELAKVYNQIQLM